MSNEIQVRSSLRIRKTSGTLTLVDESRSFSFNMDMSSTQGGAPGAMTSVSYGGAQVAVDETVDPGAFWGHNHSASYAMELGVKDLATGYFYPLVEWPAGAAWGGVLAKNLLELFGTGTGTGVVEAQFWLRCQDPAGTINGTILIWGR